MKLTLKFASHVAAAAAALFLFGCAPPAPTPPTDLPGSDRATALKNYYNAALATNTNDSADWRCPSSPNILLRSNIGPNGFDYSGNGTYTACSSRTNLPEFKISGSTSAATICIFPMYAASSNSISLIDTPQCFSPGGQDIKVTFSRKEINYLVIVDANYTNAFTQCLSGPTACPPRSEGFLP